MTRWEKDDHVVVLPLRIYTIWLFKSRPVTEQMYINSGTNFYYFTITYSHIYYCVKNEISTYIIVCCLLYGDLIHTA